MRGLEYLAFDLASQPSITSLFAFLKIVPQLPSIQLEQTLQIDGILRSFLLLGYFLNNRFPFQLSSCNAASLERSRAGVPRAWHRFGRKIVEKRKQFDRQGHRPYECTSSIDRAASSELCPTATANVSELAKQASGETCEFLDNSMAESWKTQNVSRVKSVCEVCIPHVVGDRFLAAYLAAHTLFR